MSNKKNIENLFKEKLAKQEFDIQEEWMNGMSDMLDDYNEEPQSKKGFFFILGVLILFIGLIGTFFILKKDNKSANELLVSKEFQRTNDTLISKKTTIESNLNDCTENNNLLIENKENCLNEKEKLVGTKPISQSVNQQLINAKLTAKKTNKASKLNRKITTSKASNQFSTTNSFYKKTKSYSVKNNKNNHLNTEQNNASQKLKENNQKEEAISKENKNEILAKKAITTETNAEKMSSSATIENIENEAKNKKIKELVEKPTPTIAIDSIIQTEKIAIKTNPKNLGLSIAITSGASFLYRNFESENQKRVQEEANKISWNAQLTIYKTFKNRLILGTGINLINYGEKIKYSAINKIVQDTIMSIEENNYINLKLKRNQGVYTFDSTYFTQFDTVQIYKDSTFLDNEITKKNGTTNFMYVEIPIQIGYKIIDTKKFAINALTGISVGFLMQNKGSYLNNENKLMEAESQKIFFNYLVSADFIYKINRQINFTISPHFKYNLYNLSTLNSTKRKYNTLGINGGLLFNF